LHRTGPGETVLVVRELIGARSAIEYLSVIPPMKTLFRELLAEAKRVNPSTAATLRPGLSRDVVEKTLARLPYEITTDVASLYEWADGADGPFELLPGGYFIPLEQAMSEFKVFHELAQEMDEEEDPHRDCFRFLSDWSDGGYAFGRVDSPSKGRIVKLCIHETWLIGFTDSEHLVKTSIECYRQGIMRSADHPPDFTRFYKLAARLNPGYRVWRPSS
jgi:hypothetical protein